MRTNSKRQRKGSAKVFITVSLLALLVVGSLKPSEPVSKKTKVLNSRESSASIFRQNQKKDEQWLEKLVQRSQSGCGQASYQLGSIYELGKHGVPKNFSTSLAYYEEAKRRKVSGARYAVKRLKQWIFISSQKQRRVLERP